MISSGAPPDVAVAPVVAEITPSETPVRTVTFRVGVKLAIDGIPHVPALQPILV